MEPSGVWIIYNMGLMLALVYVLNTWAPTHLPVRRGAAATISSSSALINFSSLTQPTLGLIHVHRLAPYKRICRGVATKHFCYVSIQAAKVTCMQWVQGCLEDSNRNINVPLISEAGNGVLNASVGVWWMKTRQ